MKQAGVYLAVPKWEYLGSNFYGNLGEVYKVQNKYKEAIENFQRGLVILKNILTPTWNTNIMVRWQNSAKLPVIMPMLISTRPGIPPSGIPY